MTYEHTSRTICFTLIFESLLHPFLDLLEKIYLSYVHWNIVGGASDTPPVPYVNHQSRILSNIDNLTFCYSERYQEDDHVGYKIEEETLKIHKNK